MNIEDIKKPENIIYKKTPILTDAVMHYCPGCSHGTVHKLVAEVIEEMGIQEETIAISPVGCSVFAYNYLNVDWQQAAHGRAPALATAAKRLNPYMVTAIRSMVLSNSSGTLSPAAIRSSSARIAAIWVFRAL